MRNAQFVTCVVFGVTLLFVGGFIGSNFYPKVESVERITHPDFIEITGRVSLTDSEFGVMIATVIYFRKKLEELRKDDQLFDTQAADCLSLPVPLPCLEALRDKVPSQDIQLNKISHTLAGLCFY